MALAHHGIEIETVSEPKQTETTQRWKLTLRCSPSRLPVHTKIEFSRRGLDQGTEFGPVDSQLIADYTLAPILSTHYNRDRALYHKLEALAGLSETQARDVFDLYHLRHSGARLSGLSVSEELVVTAQETALRVGYRDFLGQVVAYLPANYQEQYSDPAL